MGAQQRPTATVLIVGIAYERTRRTRLCADHQTILERAIDTLQTAAMGSIGVSP
jgi:hypothetical protein